MDFLPEDKYFKDFSGRQLCLEKARSLPARNVFMMLILTVVTVGIYPIFWIYRKVLEINELFSERPIGQKWIVCFLLFQGADYAIYFYDLFIPGVVPEFAQRLVAWTARIFFLFLIFMIRNRLNALIGAKPHDQFWVKGWLTFFFFVFYLQYKINEIHEYLRGEKGGGA